MSRQARKHACHRRVVINRRDNPSLLCEYIPLEHMRVPVIFRVNQAEYVIHSNVVAPQEHVQIYSTLKAVREAGTRFTPNRSQCPVLAFTRYYYSQSCIAYGIQKGGGRVDCIFNSVQYYCNSKGNASGTGLEKEDCLVYKIT